MYSQLETITNKFANFVDFRKKSKFYTEMPVLQKNRIFLQNEMNEKRNRNEREL